MVVKIFLIPLPKKKKVSFVCDSGTDYPNTSGLETFHTPI